MTALPLLEIRDLTVEFATRRGAVRAVKKVDLSVARGETVGIVGESGSGKSVTAYAVMRILTGPGGSPRGRSPSPASISGPYASARCGTCVAARSR